MARQDNELNQALDEAEKIEELLKSRRKAQGTKTLVSPEAAELAGICIAVVGVIALVGVVLIAWQDWPIAMKLPSNTGEAGDTVGGFLAGTGALAGFLLMYAAFRLQRDEMQEHRHALHMQRVELALQRRELELTRREMENQRQELQGAKEAQEALADKQQLVADAQLRAAIALDRSVYQRLVADLMDQIRQFEHQLEPVEIEFALDLVRSESAEIEADPEKAKKRHYLDADGYDFLGKNLLHAREDVTRLAEALVSLDSVYLRLHETDPKAIARKVSDSRDHYLSAERAWRERTDAFESWLRHASTSRQRELERLERQRHVAKPPKLPRD